MTTNPPTDDELKAIRERAQRRAADLDSRVPAIDLADRDIARGALNDIARLLDLAAGRVSVAPTPEDEPNDDPEYWRHFSHQAARTIDMLCDRIRSVLVEIDNGIDLHEEPDLPSSRWVLGEKVSDILDPNGTIGESFPAVAALTGSTLTPEGTALLIQFRDENERLRAQVAALTGTQEAESRCHCGHLQGQHHFDVTSTGACTLCSCTDFYEPED